MTRCLAKGAFLALAVFLGGLSARADDLTVRMLPDEQWWGAATAFGSKMPFDRETELEIDLRASNYDNQYASLLLSNRGRIVWSDRQATFLFSNGTIFVSSDGPVSLEETSGTLRDAFLHAAAGHFPASGRMPDELFFAAPQYNTWIELTYNQNEKDVLAYADAMLTNGLPPGILMIDDTWQFGYGTWEFDPRRFHDPKGMVEKLHEKGFKVLLWVCPWVSMDSPAYRLLSEGVDPFGEKRRVPGGLYLHEVARGSPWRLTEPVPVTWWNGQSAMLDFTHPRGREWFKEQLDRLVADFGVDGFKLDGGALAYYARGLSPYDPAATSAEQANGFAAFSLLYPVCEYRHAWQFGGKGVVMRLHDKRHSWQDLKKLVPDLIAGGLLGHQFMCPDMVGGGNWRSFLPGAAFDEELFIRSAQVHALCGQMQFSASPWRVLTAEGQRIVRETVRLRQRFASRFVALARTCAKSGEPMVRNLDYVFPGRGYGKIQDQFLMGDFLLVAPQTEKDAASRKVSVPPGVWRADDGSRVEGPLTLTVETPLSRLPHFVKEES